ncbi:hypothetical protein [Halobiforma nitratireducens]|uniref:Uncharacterized protein n=1 Tax=Halobiforma nitratireducens JCM 10879 TaxID=1227454 RepID=M0M8K0_9EURY|nr:hypothetical protein [Halobiforma nitratireducens]EMA40934.1 hypothetical protein C446_07145 [Halobiforma nitratireducens JCM 10879]
MVVSVGFGVGFTLLLTTLAAMGAGWVLTRFEPDRRTAEQEPGTDASNWWLVIAAYAILAPVALGYLFATVRGWGFHRATASTRSSPYSGWRLPSTS